MGQDENKNTSALDELNRISADSNPNASANVGAGFGNTASGDIILNSQPAQRRGGKRGLFLILAIVAVVVIIILSIFLIINKKNQEAKKKEVSDKQAYAKLIQFGDTEDKRETDFSLPYEYSFIYNMANESDCEGSAIFADKIDEILSDIHDELLNSDEFQDVKKAYLMILRTCKEINEIEKVYINEGREKAKNLFADQVKDKTGEEYNVRASTGEIIVDYKNAYIEMLDVYKKYNCIDKSINYGCVDVLNSMIYELDDYYNVSINLKQTKMTVLDGRKEVSEDFYETNMIYLKGNKK